MSAAEAIEPEAWAWVEQRVAAIPQAIRNAIKRRWYETSRRSVAAAGIEAERTASRVESVSPVIAADDSSVRQRAGKAAEHCARRAAESPSYAVAWIRAARVCRRHSIEPARPDRARGFTVAGTVARMKCSRWWRRKLRASHGRAIEGAAIELGMVGPGKGQKKYASQYAVSRYSGQQQAAQEAIKQARAVCVDTDEEMALEPIIAASLANPTIRRAEMMTRVRGFDQVAEAFGHTGLFLTITCPSRFHWVSGGGANPKYDGSTPRDAQLYLREVWQRIRAALARAGINPYGLRVAEPHNDGCPHWHLLIFTPADQADEACRIVEAYALADSPDEPGADKHRFKRETIDRAKGSAVAYVAKYVAKAIDGFANGTDRDIFERTTEGDAVEAAHRIRAWASTWGIRQFQQVGGPPVTVWRELRRASPLAEGSDMELARQAADSGQWGDYVIAMGGPTAERSAHPVAIWREPASGEVNGYGEAAAHRVKGVTAGEVMIPTRERRWRVEWSSGTDTVKAEGVERSMTECIYWTAVEPEADTAPAVEPGGSPYEKEGAEAPAKRVRGAVVPMFGGDRATALESAKGGHDARPWTRGNNCTQGENGGINAAGERSQRPCERSGNAPAGAGPCGRIGRGDGGFAGEHGGADRVYRVGGRWYARAGG